MADVIADRYELGEVIGTGGNGRVYAARDRVLDRRVAVKLVDAEAVRHRDPAGRERFLDEARSSAGFIHPNAIAVFDAGEADGSLYLVMELIEGPTLAERLASGGPMDPAEAARIAADVLAALDAAHRAGIVHRDVKPANVLLDPSGTAKLADFGIAKRLDSVAVGLTSPGQLFGTPKYLAPEQVDGRPVSAATDVYATGVVLFEMLTGRPPYDLGQPMATAIAQRDAPVPDMRLIRPDVPETLVSIVETAMAKEPEARFESAAAMRSALTAPLWPAPPAAPAVVPVDPTAVMTTSGVAPTSMLRTPAASPAPTSLHEIRTAVAERRGRGARVLGVFLILVAVVAVIAVLALRNEDGDALPPAAAASTLPGETPALTFPGETAPVATVLPADTTPIIVLPSDVPMLIDYIALDPALVGPAGPALLEELRGVQGRKGKKQREAAEELSEQIEEWVDDEELDPGIGDLAVQLLARLVVINEDDED